MSKTIFFASRNEGKVGEVRAILEPLQYSVQSATDFPDLPEVIETGVTFEENALIKARAAAAATQCPTLADDSGLEVDALAGAPGVFSARYAGPDATDADRVNKLLQELAETGPGSLRTARFVAAVAVALPNGNAVAVRGVCEGAIAQAPRGEGGFGYDPIFIPKGYEKTFAELDSQEKNRISHRGQAMAHLPDLLAKILG